ncbi:hypothetical protein [Pedobacter sp. Hv1]|uniref:hypothetical protein n=1 Tax=Pedobacter sp. Hv1 TaxID=1740090 RepID=UPI0006D8AD99|nr:hypothetical protein [Pedobacter sp. Hv1]KQC01329.1 hypothetical protein AQF98_06320 [Pedobacter sp. Hv1]
MKEEKDYIGDIAAIRTMMERTSKFLSLSGWAGIMAGIYALAGAWIAYKLFYFNPNEIVYKPVETEGWSATLVQLIGLALAILILTLGTAIFLSARKANKRNEKIWNATSKQMLINMAIPLVTGGVLILILIAKGLLGLVAPLTLVFYGLAMYNASKFTYSEMKVLGLMEIALGLVGAYFIGYGLLCWAIGFGVLHIITGIYLHYKYER